MDFNTILDVIQKYYLHLFNNGRMKLPITNPQVICFNTSLKANQTQIQA